MGSWNGVHLNIFEIGLLDSCPLNLGSQNHIPLKNDLGYWNPVRLQIFEIWALGTTLTVVRRKGFVPTWSLESINSLEWFVGVKQPIVGAVSWSF